MNGRDIMIYLSLKYEGDWEKMVDAVKRREQVSEEEALEKIGKIKSQVVTILDSTYPESFKHCYKPPMVLYYYGNLSLLEKEKDCVAYIGSREASPYGLRMAMELSAYMAERDYVVVSGLARGIDAMATRGCLDKHGKAVAFLGSGIDLCYPSSSNVLYERLKKEGLIISEYPGSLPPKPENFPKRNRMVAASSHGIIVGEASKKSGTLITVAYALGLTKEIGCLPFPADQKSACNTLIKEGAYLIESGEDIDLMMGKTTS
ncbi:MAG: DNA-processing protein DprA [Bacilli bacterium]|jgi:DNA processing protein|nr:DNA-processing protein DprA [Bacilli bacterium]MCH4210463.1 DNA-processing protein DprA [Bacilli bacterium]MCH4228362.1 DNA-processing protein DprA [Bacilli bacterium]MCH4277636.1 DNA-processing protein DprA [Bacilli bacterium]MCI2054822.1 DNA-processing protein DprA [Bacilli bacterium]